MPHNIKRSSLFGWLVDPFQPTRERAFKPYQFTGSRGAWLGPLALGVALLVLSAVGWLVDPEAFYFAYLTGWVFCLTLAFGALFFLQIQHLTKAWWGVVVRRIAEALVWSFPVLFLLALPLVFGMHELFHWTHDALYVEGSPHYDPILAGKHVYLNEPFFYVRMVFYFAVWTLLAYKLYTQSIRHDTEPSEETPRKMRKTSAWGLVITALTVAFASYDLLMSLEPHWFSSIFGVYIFGGAMFSIFAFIGLASILLQKRGGMLREVITLEHYQDIGKYMFGFTVFWAYIGFSQFMLIWYGGMPEETIWFRHRLSHGWGWFSVALLVFHFVLPFLLLLPRFVKRRLPFLGFMAVWFLVMQWVDLYWIIMPVLRQEQAAFHWLDFTCWLGLFGVFVGLFIYRLSRHPLVPQNDPHLVDSLRFENT